MSTPVQSGGPPARLLQVRGLGKTYATPVLANVDFDLQRGEVHALVGENGAGKSTLCRIVAGLTPPTTGRMWLRGEPHAPRSKREAEQHGIRMVLQELHLVANLSAAENLFLDRLPHRGGWIDYARLHRQARELLERVGLVDLDPARPVRTLGVGQRQLIEIAIGLSQRCDVLILDEPTAALTDPEAELLFRQITRLKAGGVGIIYISHRLEEIRRFADRITILRDGQRIATESASAWSLEDIVRRMVGRELAPVPERPWRTPGPVALRVEGLCRGAAVRDVSFAVARGEILGFAGLMGSGRTETMRAVFGADRPDAGVIYRGDDHRPLRLRSPRDAVRHGIALVTEDRQSQGLLLPLSVRVNVSLPRLRRLSWGRTWLQAARERAETGCWIERLSVRCTSPEQRAIELSGGNQQKTVIAKWLFRDCEVLIFDEPTRGIDVGAKFEIYRLLEALAGQGKAIVMVSSDLRELLALCDRIAVMSAGRLSAIFRRGEWSQDQIMNAALSGHVASGGSDVS